MKNSRLKRVISILLSLILCVSMAIPAVAAGKPAVEITQFYMDMNSVGGISVSFTPRTISVILISKTSHFTRLYSEEDVKP